MRIVLFTETFIPKVDGIVTTLCQTVRQLESLGHQVLIVAPAGGFDRFQQSAILGIKGYSFLIYPELKLAFPRASMRAAIAAFQPDLIHAADPSLLGIAALYYGGGKHGGALRLPLVVSYHTDLAKYLRYYNLGFMEWWIWPMLRKRHSRATLTVCTSVAMIDQLREHGIDRLGLWPGGVDADLFHPGRSTEAMRLRLSDGNPHSPLLLYVGRLSAEKGIERIKPMLEAFPGARLVLVGDGPQRHTLEACFAGMPVHYAGFLHGEELAAAYASCDIFVMPSCTETLGLVVLEAMASGLPVVAARAGGIPEMIEDGVSGFLFDDAQEAIAHIRGILAGKEKGRATGLAAREQAIHHGWRTATLTLIEHYRTACENQAIVAHPEPESPSLGRRISRLCGRAALFTARKVLP